MSAIDCPDLIECYTASVTLPIFLYYTAPASKTAPVTQGTSGHSHHPGLHQIRAAHYSRNAAVLSSSSKPVSRFFVLFWLLQLPAVPAKPSAGTYPLCDIVFHHVMAMGMAIKLEYLDQHDSKLAYRNGNSSEWQTLADMRLGGKPNRCLSL